jgi:hypothetical protein
MEPSGPARWHLPHVSPGVSERRADASFSRDREESFRVVESVDIVARFREKMNMSSLSRRNVQDPRASGKLQQFDKPRSFATIAFGREEWAVLEEIMGVEG